MKVKANGIAINYQVDGPERAPWLVFSNSLATSLAMWDGQAAALKGRFRVLRYDQRGHGETEAPAGRYAFDTLLDDALVLMDALGIVKATFAGLSMGGATALGLAERQPERFERIIVAFTMPIDAAIEPAMGRADRGGAETRHRSPDRADSGALISARDSREKPALSRQDPRHDARNAGRRLYRLRRGACRA
jgi:pimeloyl-ACP methyl ester carboxylesterase